MNVELSEKSVDSLKCGVGAKLARAESGFAVASDEIVNASPPIPRKVAEAKSAASSEHLVLKGPLQAQFKMLGKEGSSDF